MDRKTSAAAAEEFGALRKEHQEDGSDQNDALLGDRRLAY